MFACVNKTAWKLRQINTYIQVVRNFRSTSAIHSTTRKSRDPVVVVSDDGGTIFCWHPEPQFSYEHTKPLPRNREENEMGDSVLKLQHFKDMTAKPGGPTDRELMQMFNTNIWPWRYVPQKRKIKPNPPKDRDAI